LNQHNHNSTRIAHSARGLRYLEGREWWLWGFATLVTVVLTIGIASLAFHGGEFRTNVLDSRSLREWVRGLAALVLLFDIYTLYQHLQLQRLRRRLSEREQLFHLITESAADMIAVVDRQGHRLYNSPSYEKVLGYTAQELGQTSSLEQVHPDDRLLIKEAAKNAFQNGTSQCLEYRIRHKDGAWRVLESRSSVIPGGHGETEALVIVSRDITDRKQAEALLEHRTLHDELTNLPNRTLFLDRVQRAIAVAQRHSDFKFAVFLIDIDEFKVFNDSLGYFAGDELLIQVARRLSSSVRSSDTISHRKNERIEKDNSEDAIARPGGDEFALLASELRGPSDAVRVATRLQERLAQPFAVGGQEITISASIGVAFCGDGAVDAKDMLRNAEIAMYRAKRAGKARCEVFDTAMQVEAIKRLKLESDMRRAVENRDFLVYYQPIVSLQTGQIVSVEALSRWELPTGIVMPSEFIPVAEETGMILPINHQLLYQACEQVRRWQTEYPELSNLRLNMNITAKQLAQPDLARQIADALLVTGMGPGSLDLEITEGIAMVDAVRSAQILSEMSALGMHVSIDDFGTGYSSLSRLQRFAVDALKIDRSFIFNLDLDEDSREIVRVVIVLAHNLDLKVTAEGIENEDQRRILLELGCDYGQGYLFSRPVAPEQLQQMLATTVQA
jgi:PAS domain S-box-containing protein